MLKRYWRLLVRAPLVIIWLFFLLRLSYLGGNVLELATWEENETLGAITVAIFTIVLWALTSRGFGQWQYQQKTNHTKSDSTIAMRELRLSADKGDSEAMHWLGIMYNEGKGVSINHREAAQWFLKAAEGGHNQAQFGLGCLYQTGTGVAANLHEAIRWWRKAAEQGDSMAQYNLGLMYAQGEGVQENPLEARQWIEKAAEQGETRAFYNLGILYLAEPKDYVRAYMWWTLSVMNGEDQMNAAERIKGLEPVMTPEQIAEAKRRAREWTQKENKISKDIYTEYQRCRSAKAFMAAP